jgi:hypothetical protein
MMMRKKASGSSFSDPTDIDGLVGWWDFSDATTLYTDAGSTLVSSDGDLIYQANDKSGSNWHHTQATEAARPTYKTNIKNGLSIARCDGGDSLADAYELDQPITICFVANASALSGYLIGGSYAPRVSLTTPSDIVIWCSSTYRQSGVISTGSFYQIVLQLNGASSAVRSNGSEIGTGNPGGSGFNSASHSLFQRTGSYFTGDVGEILYYNSIISGADLANLETYLNDKWSIY